jgi:hypothetical protein
VYIGAPISSRFDFVLLRDHVPEADFLIPVETEVGLFVELRGAVGVRGDGGVFVF